ncbi:MAG: hypothetical protein H7645_05345 [Candidatus Heimdallarchaeota archaeon]|nr:hypothetical protein [Candidatus Heimdallarchaeota archaeon]MCK4769747.1 hypothetical protein [Candidatus Heimdallarchaeota archaeon]
MDKSLIVLDVIYLTIEEKSNNDIKKRVTKIENRKISTGIGITLFFLLLWLPLTYIRNIHDALQPLVNAIVLSIASFYVFDFLRRFILFFCSGDKKENKEETE